MNQLFALALIGLSLQLANPVEAQAADKKVCKVATNDIGTIVGRGPNKEAAFEDAATQCFDRRAQLHRMKNGSNFDEDQGLAVIDTCANIKCG